MSSKNKHSVVCNDALWQRIKEQYSSLKPSWIVQILFEALDKGDIEITTDRRVTCQNLTDND